MPMLLVLTASAALRRPYRAAGVRSDVRAWLQVGYSLHLGDGHLACMTYYAIAFRHALITVQKRWGTINVSLPNCLHQHSRHLRSR